MDNLIDGARRIGVIALAGCAVGLVVLAVAQFVLPRLGAILTCFALSPGGLILIILLWRWLNKRGGG